MLKVHSKETISLIRLESEKSAPDCADLRCFATRIIPHYFPRIETTSNDSVTLTNPWTHQNSFCTGERFQGLKPLDSAGTLLR